MLLFAADNLSQGSGSDATASRPYALKGMLANSCCLITSTKEVMFSLASVR